MSTLREPAKSATTNPSLCALLSQEAILGRKHTPEALAERYAMRLLFMVLHRSRALTLSNGFGASKMRCNSGRRAVANTQSFRIAVSAPMHAGR